MNPVDHERWRNTAPMPGRGDVAPGGDGPHDGGVEAKIAKLEAGMGHVRQDIGELRTDVREMRGDISGIRTTDFRLLFGAIIAVALGLAGLMAHGFHWL